MSRRINDFCHLLIDEQSNLGHMVYRLEIYVDHDRTILQEFSNLHGLLAALVRRAINLNVLQIHFRGRSRFPLSWKDFPSQIDSGLREICQLLPVNHLHFSQVVWIPSSLAAFHQAP